MTMTMFQACSALVPVRMCTILFQVGTLWSIALHCIALVHTVGRHERCQSLLLHLRIHPSLDEGCERFPVFQAKARKAQQAKLFQLSCGLDLNHLFKQSPVARFSSLCVEQEQWRQMRQIILDLLRFSATIPPPWHNIYTVPTQYLHNIYTTKFYTVSTQTV